MSSTGFYIVPRRGWQTIDLSELWRHRELLLFLVWRDLKIRYRQTVLGGLWAVLQPLIAMVVFAGVFSRVSNVHGDGTPYILFLYAGLVPWTFFSNALGLASNSLLASEQMIRKVYFPRMLLPLATTAAFTLDMLVSTCFMLILLGFYRVVPTVNLLWMPVLMLAAILCTIGPALLLAALNVRYRDIKYIVPFFTQMMFFLTPVLYPVTSLPKLLKPLLQLNPLVGLIEAFRASFLGRSPDWNLIWPSLAVSLLILIAGVSTFKRVERSFADVI